MPPPPINPPPILPPIVTLSSLSQAVDSVDSPLTATATPATAELLSASTYTPTEPDYFGSRWQSKSPSQLTSGVKRSAPSASSRANVPSPIIIDRSGRTGSPGPPESLYSPRTTARVRNTDRRRVSQNGHRRSRGATGKGSGTAEGESSASDHKEGAEKPQKRKAPSQKAMLSKALEKAHHAVTLDQHSNYEGAMHAYQEACSLLRRVMNRSSGVEDRLKLDAVRNTYEARIKELRSTELSYRIADGKALPQRPQERDSNNSYSERLSIVTDDDEGDAEGTTILQGHEQNSKAKQPHVGTLAHIPPRRQSLQTSPYKGGDRQMRTSGQMPDRQPLHFQHKSPDQTAQDDFQFEPSVFRGYVPPPLSPRRLRSPAPFTTTRDILQSSTDATAHSDEPNQSDAVRQDNGEHTSWLNTINESSGSSSSSVHSRRSSIGLRRKHIRATSGQTEADFDAAFDATYEAVQDDGLELDATDEANFDDGFEPDDEDDGEEALLNDPQYLILEPEPLSQSRRNVELAKENVREAEREAVIAQAKERDKQQLQAQPAARNSTDQEGDDEDDEEERMLEEMTRDYIMDDLEYDTQTKSALPRQSDSSGFSGRTWGSSIGSNPTSAATSLSTVVEALVLPSMDTQLKDNPLPPPLHPPPSSALPPPPVQATAGQSQPLNGDVASPPSLVNRNTSPGVRDRRLSGTKKRPLKIETHTRVSGTSETEAVKTQALLDPSLLIAQPIPEPPQSALIMSESQQNLPSLACKPIPSPGLRPSSRKGSSPLPASDSTDMASSTASALTKVTSAESDNSVPSSPARFGSRAATGLRNKGLTVSVPDVVDASPNTSFSSVSSTPKPRKDPSPALPVLPTPIETSFITKGQPMGGIYLFDSDIHAPNSPGSPNPLASNAPLPLEPCPESTLLRPFWFLRTIYQTIAHPRGGYISTRLFIPRDIWRVKNIKLKNVEDKVSSCDLLTAALLKLGKVDTLDANAVLEEMQFFESVMEQVQTTLAKKLGNEVGVQGAAQVFKGIQVVDESAHNLEALAWKTTNASSRSNFSWKKLRGKNSLGPGLPSGGTTNVSKNGSQEGPTIKSLPMTKMQNPRFPKRDPNQVQCLGPNPSYMGALARLCDAVQILDQIARQVEDPGLKHSSQTHVGLELSARHASEFFGFYVCRFVLADIGIMLDKFIKRGSEWVLA
ncbi:hypothetical protein JMJ35_002785 [Cladonia borealis]|uniref:MIT domain-containing protein n=1 Tax=Cladonia borealis TaxID=184061 RepID=A0AA39R8H3_9LECA|nr:hypothetical protein JMJ35_002785 [Cladonia borealis]